MLTKARGHGRGLGQRPGSAAIGRSGRRLTRPGARARHRGRVTTGVPMVAGAALASLLAAGVPAAGLHQLPAAVAATTPAGVSEQACTASGGVVSLGLRASSGQEGVGRTVSFVVDLSCQGVGPPEPLGGTALGASLAPSGIAVLASPARVATDASGAARFALTGRRAGTTMLVVSVDDGGICASTVAGTCQERFLLRLAPSGEAPRPTKGPQGSRRRGILPPANPRRNAPFIAGITAPSCSARRIRDHHYDTGLRCASYYLARINRARARLGEHLPPMRLPRDWARLTPAEQLFVTADLERVDRGLPPYLGLSRRLNALAEAGARAGDDPGFPSSGALGGGSNEFPGEVSATEADYGWMYSDGVGGNAECHVPSDKLCWGHRDNVLGGPFGLGCADCVMGAGVAYRHGGGDGSDLTELFVKPARPDAFPLYFTWAKDVAPFLKG